jgi:poly(3-hydroxyalkanoate) synthetase
VSAGLPSRARGLDDLVGKLGFDAKDAQRPRFAISLAIDAFAPLNIPWTNPILKRFVETGGKSAIVGLQNILQVASADGSAVAQFEAILRSGGSAAHCTQPPWNLQGQNPTE